MVIRIAIVLAALTLRAHAIIYTPITYPGSIATEVTGISNGRVVGSYTDPSGSTHGFIYSDSTFTQFDYPQTPASSGAGKPSTSIRAIDGDQFIGLYVDPSGNSQNFHFDGQAFQIIDVPGSTFTQALAISDGTIAGFYVADHFTSPVRGFLFDGQTYQSIELPDSSRTVLEGIDGDTLVGLGAFETTGSAGFVYDGTDFSLIRFPDSEITVPAAIDGDNIVGYFHDPSLSKVRGFLFDGSTYRALDFPGGLLTQVTDIDGDLIVGQTFVDGAYTGFIATISEPSVIPEPFSLTAAVILAALAMARRSRTHSR